MRLTKLRLIILGAIVLGIVVYLNRSYDRIYSYNQKIDTLVHVMQTKYKLQGGIGIRNIKYVALGDSLTYGLGASSYQETFPYIIGQKLLTENKSVEVINLAASGAVVGDLVSNQLPQAIEEKPDFVTILIGTNDVHNFANKQSFRDSFNRVVSSLKQNTATKILVLNIPYLGTKGLILPPHNLIIDNKINEFNMVIREVAALNEVKYIDLYNLSKEPFLKDRNLYSSDQFHPSGKGYTLWGNLINAN